MKFVLAAAAAFICLAPGAAFAQTTPAPAPAPAPAAAPAVATKFNLDTPIATLVADPAAKAVLDADLGVDVTTLPTYGQFSAYSLRVVQPFSNGAITDDMMKKLEADLTAIK